MMVMVFGQTTTKAFTNMQSSNYTHIVIYHTQSTLRIIIYDNITMLNTMDKTNVLFVTFFVVRQMVVES